MKAALRLLAEDRKLVNLWLRESLRFGREVPGRLAQAMRYAVLGPGKRVRAALALESFRAAGGAPDETVMPFCCGIEMVHAFSLVHDDLPSMDDDDFRRGKPSLHRKFGEANAILAADALFALAFELFASAAVPATRRARAIGELARAVGPAGMAGGQVRDLARGATGGKRGMDLTHRLKTAEFISSSLAVGGIVAGARPGVLAKLRRAGLLLGMLFQITDDLLDANTGENPSRTMVGLYGAGGTRSRAETEAARAEKLLASLGPAYATLAVFPAMVLNRRS